MKQQYSTPILSEAIEEQLNNAIEQFQHRQKWKDWGMDKVREQGAAILLYGPPGTGKSITAQYLAKKLHLSIVEINMAEFGSHIPGELARNIRNLFGMAIIDARNKGKPAPMIFMDECDHVLVSRTKLDAHSLWMLEPITALLTEIGKYEGLIVLATNLWSYLDAAVDRRLLAKIFIDRPAKAERKRIWLEKWPSKFPVKLESYEAEALSCYDMTGAEIENAFILWVSKQIREDVLYPDIGTLINLVIANYKLET